MHDCECLKYPTYFSHNVLYNYYKPQSPIIWYLNKSYGEYWKSIAGSIVFFMIMALNLKELP